MSISRIYQGRVTRLDFLSDEKKNPAVEKTFPLAELGNEHTSPLWQHHELFQDAVNYYIFQLIGLAGDLDDAHPLSKLRKQMKETWETFPRPIAGAQSMRDSLTPHLKLTTRASFEEALQALDFPSEVTSKMLSLAVSSLVHDLGGDSKIQQGSKTYLPLFCIEKTTANFPRAKVNQLKARGKAILPSLLWSADLKNPNATLEQLSFEYFANPTTDGKSLKGAEAKAKLGEALKLEDESEALADVFKQNLETTLQELPDDIEFPAYTGGSINKEALKRRFFLYLLLRYLNCDPELLKRLRDTFPEPKKINTDYQLPEAEIELQSEGDDPIKLARGQRGYVFPAFTTLPKWKPVSPSEPKWKSFDICAFAEALKTLNQFKQKTEERQAKLKQAEGEFNFMMGEHPLKNWPKVKKDHGIADSKEGEQKVPPILAGDARYDALNSLLKDLRELLDEDTQNEYAKLGPTSSSLRCWRGVRNSWLKVAKKAKDSPSEQDLRAALAEEQKDHKFDFGYVALYQELAKPEHHFIWKDLTEAEEAALKTEGRALSVLHAAARLRSLAEDIQQLVQPIRFTPAEPRHSRRLHMLSDMPGSDAVKYGPHGEADVSIVTSHNGHYQRRRARLHFSAPRLRRDGLDQGSALSRWLQPLMKGLGVTVPKGLVLTSNGKDAKDPALALMPDWAGDGRELRMLVNFPVTLDTEWLSSQLGALTQPTFRWTNFQFNGTRDEQLHLYWPGMKNEPKKDEAWWNHPDIKSNGLNILSVDIGQRRAGDWALLHTSASNSSKAPDEKHFVNLGEISGTHWHTRLDYLGSFALPGEGGKIYLDGKLSSEPFGKRGRPVKDKNEYDEAAQIANTLSAHESDFNLNSWIGNWIDGKGCSRSFPEQNDGLSALYGRALSRYRAWHRWSWFLKSNPEKACREIIASGYRNHFSKFAGELIKEGKSTRLEGQKPERVCMELETEINELRSTLQTVLVQLSERIIPLKKFTWIWQQRTDEIAKADPKDLPIHHLTTEKRSSSPPWIQGQRGLSFARLEQLDQFRKHLLSLNRILRHQFGEKPDFGSATLGEGLPDPCESLTKKLNRMKKERVNQTANLILAQALGIRLCPPHKDPEQKERDVHGTYERIPKRKPVDFIVIENLDRYQFDNSRAPRENGRLMKWCHRAVRDKLLEMCEPFGLTVVEVHAAYTSKIDARTGAPGFRAQELTLADLQGERWQKSSPEKPKQTLPDTLKNFSRSSTHHRRDRRLSFISPRMEALISSPLFQTNNHSQKSVRPIKTPL